MMTIIVLWILLSIIALIVILLHFSIYAYIKANEDGFEIKVKYLFFTIYPRKPKKKKIKKQKSSGEKIKNEFSDSLDEELNEEFPDEQATVYDDTNVFNTDESDVSDIVSEERSEEKFAAQKDNKQPVPEKKETNKKDTETKENKKENKDKSSKNGKFATLKEKFYKIKPYLPMGWKYFKKLLKTIRITDVKIEVNVGREDAHEAAIYYGAVQGAVFNTLGQICNMFTVKIKKADVNCIFIKNIISGSGECYVRVRPSAMISIVFCIGVNFLIIFFRQKQKNKKKSKNQIKSKEETVMEVK